jgi:hypothetical protein
MEFHAEEIKDRIFGDNGDEHRPSWADFGGDLEPKML